MIKLCVFDLDGTLVNSLSDLAAAMNYALNQQNFPSHDPEKYRLMVGSGVAVLADRAMNTPNPDPAVKQKLLQDFSDYYTAHCLDFTRPYEGIPALLEQLAQQGVLTAVNSNKPDRFARYIVTTLFPDADFASVVGKREEFERKPAPDGVWEILRQTGVSKEECLFIGDSNVDAYTARNAGVPFCGVSWGFRSCEELQKAGAKTIAQTPDDILGVVRASRS